MTPKKKTDTDDSLEIEEFIERSDGEQLSLLLASQTNLPVLSLESIQIPDDVIALVPKSIARAHCVLPVSLEGDVLTVAMADPADANALVPISRKRNLKIEINLASARELIDRIYRHYP